jgi:hypothetical protein
MVVLLLGNGKGGEEVVKVPFLKLVIVFIFLRRYGYD